MKALAAAVLVALLAGCSTVKSIPIPRLFHVPVSQGNVIEGDKLAQLELGMTPRQVRYLLGTPLIDNNFGDHRWDYVFYYRDRNANAIESKLSLFFENDKLTRIEGNRTYQAQLPEDTREIDPEKLKEEAEDKESALPPSPPAPEPTEPEPDGDGY